MKLPTLTVVPQRKVARWATVVLAVVIAGLSGGQAWTTLDDLPEDAVLRYGENVVTEEELAERVDVLSALYGVRRPESADDSDDFDRSAAKSFAVSLVLERAAQRREIVIADKQARDQLDSLIEDQLQGGRPAFVQFLENSGISEGDVLDEIKRQLATARIVEEVVEDAPDVTDDDVRAAFEENRREIATPETRKVANIVVETKAEAERVVRLAGQGRGFGQLAKDFSRDGSTRDKGGVIGTVTRQQLQESYAEVAFSTGQGDLFGPLETQYGWNVGKVLSVEQGRQLSFKEVRKQLRIELENKARLEVWRDHLGTLLEEAEVEYAPSYRPDDPDQAPDELPQQTPAPSPGASDAPE